ncbi:MAG: peptidase domain-containing ABC transporter [Chloroflexota bacterium]|nr:peptidase domain-containing ABC transporter [Chloroflexota bacterium]
MTEKEPPAPYAPLSLPSLPRPVRLLRNSTTQATPQETPPPLALDGESVDTDPTFSWPMTHSQLMEQEIEARSTLKMFAVKVPQQKVTEDREISTYATVKTPIVKPPGPQMPATTTPENQLIYGSAYAQRVERRRRAEEKKLNWSDLKQFSQFVVPFKWYIVLALILTIGVGLTALPLPFIFRTMLDEVFQRHDITLFLWCLAFLLVVSLLEELLTFLNRNVLGILSRLTNLNITYRFYRHLLRMPLASYQKLSGTGQMLSRLNEVISAQQTVIQVAIDAVVNGILTIIYIGVLFLTEWRLTLAVLIIAPFYAGVNLYFNRRSRRLSRQVLESYAVMNGAMYEGLNGLKTVKALAAEHRLARKIKKLVMHTNQLSFRRTIFQSETNLVVGIVQALAVIIVLGFGGSLVLNQAMSPGQLAAFVLILRQLASPVSALNGVNQQIQTAAVAIDRLFEILNQPVESDADKGIEIPDLRGDILLEHVHFSYTPEIEVLHDITLNVPAGSTVALVGRSGAGKTTIANLLMRFYAPNSGRITIDGFDLHDLQIESLRSQFGVILQDDSLFSGTIEENLTFGLLRKVPRAELAEAARNANILDFIQSLPLGFKTVLIERGQGLSGGQRQRLALARMFLRQPKILVMDEPSSALDNESEALIQQALKRLTQGRTTFIIAHRLSTIRKADQIVVIDNGCIAEQGTHEELLANQGVYWHLYNSYGRM